MELRAARLLAPAGSLDALAEFYGRRLGLDVDGGIAVGASQLEFAPAAGTPFYHFALLAPGDRFDALLRWIEARVELLPNRETGERVFDFGFWDARACYFHDPAGNIVELIAHRGVEETGAEGAFDASELRGLSELGLVGDKAALGARLADLGVEVWSGSLADADGLAFAGEQARTLILCPPGRPWLPTGRPAEAHEVELELDVGRFRL